MLLIVRIGTWNRLKMQVKALQMKILLNKLHIITVCMYPNWHVFMSSAARFCLFFCATFHKLLRVTNINLQDKQKKRTIKRRTDDLNCVLGLCRYLTVFLLYQCIGKFAHSPASIFHCWNAKDCQKNSIKTSYQNYRSHEHLHLIDGYYHGTLRTHVIICSLSWHFVSQHTCKTFHINRFGLHTHRHIIKLSNSVKVLDRLLVSVCDVSTYIV